MSIFFTLEKNKIFDTNYADGSTTTMTTLNRQKMKELRETLGMDQGQAATAAGIKRPHWNMIENGRGGGLTVSTLGSIARALKCSPCDLLLEEPDADAKPSPAKKVAAKSKPAAKRTPKGKA